MKPGSWVASLSTAFVMRACPMGTVGGWGPSRAVQGACGGLTAWGSHSCFRPLLSLQRKTEGSGVAQALGMKLCMCRLSVQVCSLHTCISNCKDAHVFHPQKQKNMNREGVLWLVIWRCDASSFSQQTCRGSLQLASMVSQAYLRHAQPSKLHAASGRARKNMRIFKCNSRKNRKERRTM